MALPKVKDGTLEQSSPEIRDHYEEFSKRLTERQEEIIGRVREARANLDEQVMTAPGDVADESVIDTSADYFLRLANNHQHELVEIQEAMDRMRRGVYGTCESCEDPISLERLRHLPYARACIDCQSARERGNPLRGLPKI
jgi:DnaK suppressor protein